MAFEIEKRDQGHARAVHLDLARRSRLQSHSPHQVDLTEWAPHG